MKRYTYILAILFVFILMGCSGGSGSSGTTINDNTYDVDNSSNNALMGPLKNATVNVYKFTDLNTSVETVQTNDLGAFSLSLTGISDSEMFIVAVSGGKDVDANDDGILDDIPTNNSGTIRGIAKASDLKSGNVNITLLSEILYTYVEHLIGNVHQDDLEQAMNTISAKLLKSSINRNVISYRDINNFVPLKQESKDKLDFNYSDLIGENSLADAIHNDSNNTILEDKLKNVLSTRLSLRDSGLIKEYNFYKVNFVYEDGIESIESNGSLISVNSNKSILNDFVMKDNNISFNLNLDSGYKIIRWHGCDSSTETSCSIIKLNADTEVYPVIVKDEIILNQNIVIHDLSNAYITIDDNNYTVSIDLDDDNTSRIVQSINIGDVIISSKNNIFTRKVNSISKIDDYNYVLVTSFIPIEEVVTQGYISISKDITPGNTDNNVSLRFINNRGRSFNLNNSFDKNSKAFILDFGDTNRNRDLEAKVTFISVEIADGVKVEGSIKIEPSIDFDWAWSSGTLDSIRVIPAVKMTPDLKLILTKEQTFGGTQYDQYLGNIEMNQIIMVGIIPVLLTEDIKLYIGAEGKLSAAVAIGGEYTRNQKMGFRWSKNNGLNLVLNATNSGRAYLPEYQIEGEAGAYVNVEPGVRIYGLGFGMSNKVGIYINSGVQAGANIGLSNSGVDLDVLKLYYNIYAKYVPRLTLSLASSVANNDFMKILKHDFEDNLPPMVEVKYTMAQGSWELMDGVISKKGSIIEIEGNNHSELIKQGETLLKDYVYKIYNKGDEKLYWQINKSGVLSDKISIAQTRGEVEAGNSDEIVIRLNIDNSSLMIGDYLASIKFYDIGSVSTGTISSIPTSNEISLQVTKDIQKISTADIMLDGESIKKIKITFSTDTFEGEGYKIYKGNYQNNTCVNNYQLLETIYGAYGIYEVNLDTLLNTNNEFKKVIPGEKYCFNITQFDANSESESLDIPLILEIPEYGTLTSAIKDNNNNPINATIRLTMALNNTFSDDSGSFNFDKLMPGKYRITIEAEGYTTVVIPEYQINSGANVLEQVLTSSEDLQDIIGIYNGKIKDAVSGNTVASATIEVREGRDTLTGTVVATLTSESNGNYSIDTLSTGQYTFTISKGGYITASENIYIVGNETNSKDLSISPILNSGEMRIKLSWGQNPSDLDSHLVKKTNDTTDYHIYYENMYSGGDNLDTDDTTSYGPETITITNLNSYSTYSYYVYHYSGSNTLKDSSAKVEIYYGDNTVTYHVPNEDGKYWKVFDITNDVITPCTSNCIRDTEYSGVSRSINRELEEERDLFRNLPSK